MKVFEDGYDRRAAGLHSVEYTPIRIIADVGIGEPHGSGSSQDRLRIETLQCIKFGSTEQDKSTATASTGSKVPASHTNETETETEAETENETQQRTAGKHDRNTPVRNSLPITRVYDPKNQLSSLIKNARENRESLKQRNDRISKAQQRSKRQYGW